MRLSRVKISHIGRFWSLSEVLFEASKVPFLLLPLGFSVLNSIPNSQKNLMIAVFTVLIALDFPVFPAGWGWLEVVLVLQSRLYTGCILSTPAGSCSAEDALQLRLGPVLLSLQPWHRSKELLAWQWCRLSLCLQERGWQ